MRMTWPFFSRCAWMAGSQPRNWVVVRSPTRFGSIGSAASMKAIEPSGGPGRSKKKTRLYRRCGIGACPRWTMRSTGMSATSHAPNEGSAETRHVTPAFASISCASSTAFVRRPTGNCRPTVFEFRPRITSRSRSVSPMDLEGRRTRREKGVLLRGLLLLFPLDLDPPRRRQLHAALAERFLRVVDMLLGRRDREDLHAGVHACGGSHGAAEGGAHSFRDAVRARPRRDLVLAEHVVRVHPELEVVRVPRLLHDVAVRGDAGRFQGDVADLTLLLGDQVDVDWEFRPQIPDVELADPDPGDSAHVPLLGVGLSADLSIHASGFARHRRRGARKGGRYLILLGWAGAPGKH